jgi:ATP-dependent exoDNAse (exonuclease V) beta subunit
MSLQFSPEAKQFAPWSMSKAEAAKNCSFAFNLRYVKKVKGVSPPASAASRIGKAAHEVLEGVLKWNGSAPLKQIAPLIKRAKVDHELTTPEIDEVMALTHAIANFQNRIEKYQRSKGVTDTFVESRFGLRVDLSPTEFWGKTIPGRVDDRGKPVKDVFFRGVWDLLMLTSGYAIIIDHKSGVAPKDTSDIKAHYAHQLNLYAVAALARFPQILGVQSALHFLQSEEIIWGDMAMSDHIRKELVPWYVEYINKSANAIAANTPQKGWYCAFCDYTSVCPLKK